MDYRGQQPGMSGSCTLVCFSFISPFFLSLTHIRYGFVPNGGRVYFSRRSQPPLLIQMVSVYVANTEDVDFLRSVLPALLTEYEFWITNRTVDYVMDQVVRYGAELGTPRPESYREDLTTAVNSS